MNILLCAADVAAEASNFEFLSFDATTIIGTLLNTFILFLVLKHFLFDRINKLFNERNSDVAKAYSDADEALKKAKDMESEYTEKLSAAKEESAEIIRNASRKAQERSDEIIGGAKDEARSIMNKASADIEIEKKHAVNQIKNEISDIALSVAEKVVGKELDKAANEKLISGFIDEIGN